MDAKFTPPHALHLEGCELKTAFNGEKNSQSKPSGYKRVPWVKPLAHAFSPP